ncbi:hypothetical protein [Streptomyces sp. NPDC055036]
MTDLDRHITGNYGEDSVPPEFTTAENLEEGDVIDVGDQTEEPVFVTVELVTVDDEEVIVNTKELSWPLRMRYDDQVTYGEK